MKKESNLLFIVLFIIISCSKGSRNNNNSSSYGSTINCTGVANKFDADVNPIFQSTCATDATFHGASSLTC